MQESCTSLSSRVQQDLAGEQGEIVRVLARLDSDAERATAVRAALPILPRPTTGVSELVALMSTSAQRTSPGSGVSTDVRRPTKAQSKAQSPLR